MPAGRPRKEIDFAQLEKLVYLQCTAVECAGFFDISEDTLDLRIKDAGYDNFTDYFKKHSQGGKISLRRWQFRLAEKGNAAMLIWLGKQYLGQTDKSEISTFEGKPFQLSYDIKKKPEDEP
jgi:hypothetical protein